MRGARGHATQGVAFDVAERGVLVEQTMADQARPLANDGLACGAPARRRTRRGKSGVNHVLDCPSLPAPGLGPFGTAARRRTADARMAPPHNAMSPMQPEGSSMNRCSVTLAWIDSREAFVVRWLDGQPRWPPRIGRPGPPVESGFTPQDAVEGHRLEHLARFVAQVARGCPPRTTGPDRPGTVREHLANEVAHQDARHHRTRRVACRAAGRVLFLSCCYAAPRDWRRAAAQAHPAPTARYPPTVRQQRA